MNLTQGNRVYWLDPDDDLASDYGEIVKVNGEVISIVTDSGSEVECYEHDLHPNDVHCAGCECILDTSDPAGSLCKSCNQEGD